MFKYKYAVGRYRNFKPGFHIVDISEYKLSEVAKYFSVLDIIIYDEFYKRNIRISLDDYFNDFIIYEGSIIDFLRDNGNNTLKYYLDYPKDEYVYGRWESIYHKAFFIHPGNVNLSNDRQPLLTANAAPDIRIVKDDKDYSDYKKLVDYSLYLMNGCFIRGVSRKDGIYLLGAGKDYISNKQDVYVSAINFEKIGKVNTIPISKEMLNRIKEGGVNRFLIGLDKNLELNNKTIWIVFNGQLCVDEEIIQHLGSNLIQFRPEYMDVLKHHLTYKQYTRTPNWKDQSKYDKYVEDCLVMHNSFIVIIDNPTVGVDINPLTMGKWPSVGYSTDKFQHPIMLENGLFPYIYRRQYGFNYRMINFDIHHEYKPVIDSVGNMSDNLIYSTSNKGMMGKLPDAFEFKITGLKYE